MDANSIPANAVRVWRGFRAATLAEPDFFQRLGSVFVPSTVEMQIQNGLDVYIPTIPCGMDYKPTTIPDETAILFWNSQQTYHDCFKTLASRTYTLTHGACYTAESRADFPLPYAGKLQLNTPFYLFDKCVDWMHGEVTHIVAGPPTDVAPWEFAANVTKIITGIQSRAQADGAIVCLGEDYLVYWQLGGASDPGLGELESAVGWSTVKRPVPTSLAKGLWDEWPGMTIGPGDSFNMQFKREWES